MKTRFAQITFSVWFAATIVILALGVASLAWEWQHAHANASNRRIHAVHHHSAVPSKAPGITPEKNNE
jgi:hypothetical protein